ncbi:MAG: histidine phosphatase family protein [Candidatus Nanopelagicales bacterium]
MRTLILQRHAKSDYPTGVADHDRPLSARGQRDAHAAGVWLAARNFNPAQALVSTAVRTRQTWDVLQPYLPMTSVTWDSRIYEATATTLRRVLGDISDDVTSVILVGHNPGLEVLAASLARGGSTSALAAMAQKYPTSAIAVVQSEKVWAQFDEAELVEFAVPRG